MAASLNRLLTLNENPIAGSSDVSKSKKWGANGGLRSEAVAFARINNR
jgi:hypothetical protein